MGDTAYFESWFWMNLNRNAKSVKYQQKIKRQSEMEYPDYAECIRVAYNKINELYLLIDS